MRVFFDTNVLLDLLDEDRPNHVSSTAILRATEQGHIHASITAISILNAIYVMRKVMPSDTIARYMVQFMRTVRIAPTGPSQLLAAMTSGWKDLEDAVQFQSALAAGPIDAIVTTDPDFKQQKSIPLLTPQQLLKKLN